MRKIAIALFCVIAFSFLFACQKAKEEVTAPAVSQTAPAQSEGEATAQNPSENAQQETPASQSTPAEEKKAE